MLNKNKIDRVLFSIILILTTFGVFTFLSASLGLLARDGAKYSSVVFNQLGFGLIGGLILMYITSKIPYKFWKIYSFWIFIGAVFLTLLVFIPGIGFEFAGAKRWISIGPISLQPSELLKFAYIFYVAGWLSFATAKKRIKTFQWGTLPFLIISGIVAGILVLQPDNDTMFITLLAGAAMYFVSGANWKHICLVVLLGIIGATIILFSRPYIMERVITFINPASDPLASGYQVQQSLIAVGSGGLAGRGFGQSIQKFNFLPEPIGDSIFAVIAEEFGFIGALFLIMMYVALLIQSIRISLLSRDSFGGLLILGIAILIVSQSFLNIASMLGIFPLSGLPLLFVSHGGTALLFTLAASGIMLNISRFKKQQ